MNLNSKNYFLKIVPLGLLILTGGSILFGQVSANKYDAVYAKEFESVRHNSYNKNLISRSETKPPKNWNKYQGGKLRTPDELFQFNKNLGCHEFPTNSTKFQNEYLIFYFSKKTANCPTLFSLYNYYRSDIEAALSEEGLPTELGFIPMVSSAFNPNSTNEIGGTGFWHLNYVPAVKYGLRIDEYVDERKDMAKSSKAAAAYLKDLYTKYNNWELTLAAYSSGVVNISKAMNRHNVSNYKELIPYLPKETKDFVQAFVALHFISSYDDYGAIALNPVIEADTVSLDRPLVFKAINAVIKTKTAELSFLNYTYIKETAPANYPFLLPKGKGEEFKKLKDSIYFYQDSVLNKPIPREPEIVIPKNGESVEYTVRSGDVLGAIAQRYNVRVSQLQAWNNLNGTRINIGQKLIIYSKPKKPIPMSEQPKPKPTPVETPKPTPSGDYSTYKVKSGDNLWVIAKKYPGVSADDIMKFNGIDANLDVGQQLKIPKQ